MDPLLSHSLLVFAAGCVLVLLGLVLDPVLALLEHTRLGHS